MLMMTVRWLATCTLLASLASAVSFAPSNATVPVSVLRNLTVWHDTTVLPQYHVVSLTNNNDQNTTITGPLLLTTQDTKSGSVNSSQVAFLSCDSGDYNGFITVSNVFNLLQSSNVASIVMYSATGNFCDTTSNQGYNGAEVFSMVGYQDSASLIGVIKSMQNSFYARIGPDNNTSSGGDNSNNGNSWYAPPGTALAMIILYAITGCITALFVLIIITGTIRAHRHPERYGRRVIGGRTRQTRVGGLARAMLDTFPLVKFGDRAEDKSDVELSNTPEPSQPAQPVAKTASTEVTERAVDDGIAPAAGASTSTDSPGCSICTEDFELGQDQRVLPCEHRFHPACIDPWLLNVSGTCPLCRVDLRPPEEVEEEDEAAPEPITPASRRRSILMAITNFRRPDGMTREERIAALRRYRNRHDVPESPRAGSVADDAAGSEEQNGRSAQLRRLFNVRTWRTTARRTEQPSSSTAATAS